MTTLKLLSLFVILAFTTSLTAIGHGVVPIGLVLVWSMTGLLSGPRDTVDLVWVSIVAISWGAIFVLAAGCFMRGRWASRFILSGAILCSLAWAAFLYQSEAADTTFVFSVHFLFADVLLFRYLLLHLPNDF